MEPPSVRKVQPLAIGIIATVLILALANHRNRVAMDKLQEGPDALEWLNGNVNPHPLASNHFRSHTHAVAFVTQLKETGAEAVTIPAGCIHGEAERLREEGGPYADGLVVKLPRDGAVRRRVLALCEREVDDEFRGKLESSVRNDMLFLWWD